MPLQIGQIVDGKVTKITDFGAFVRIDTNQTGLVHISEVANTYVTNINSYLKINDSVKVKVISISDDGKISLSIKQAAPKIVKKGPIELEFSRKTNAPSNESLEDKIGRFMKESDERMQEWKKNIGAKKNSKSYSKR